MKKQGKRLELLRATLALISGHGLERAVGGILSDKSQNEDCSGSCNTCSACITCNKPCWH